MFFIFLMVGLVLEADEAIAFVIGTVVGEIHW